ncbi:hypothetical protein [Bradyrhizobium sp. SYSU BS000235]|uniref:hypothetical protein n=1 Tax=Bradyrhizobium sp. SYSU BS000235 TaxID=3411332 RepID=UPI003C71D013
MPAFMFEKISSAPRKVQAPVTTEPRGIIKQMMGRLAKRRLERDAGASRQVQLNTGYTEADGTPRRTRGE